MPGRRAEVERSMLQVRNETPYPAERSIQVDRRGSQVWVVVVKATFRIGTGSVAPEPVPAHDPEPVCLAPVFAGEPGRSSLLREPEMVAEHPGTDVTLIGTACAPGGRPVDRLDVGLRVGDVAKTVRVFGDRAWQPGLLGPRPTPPRPFATMPLGYE